MACILLVLGGGLFFFKDTARQLFQSLMRSRKVEIAIFCLATFVFLLQVSKLGEADFGQYRGLLMLLFGGIALSSVFYVRDFLGVRGLAALILLSAGSFLDAAYMQSSASRLLLVAMVYLWILKALILGASPFYLRNFINWLYNQDRRRQLFAGGLCLYGIVLLVTSLSY